MSHPANVLHMRISRLLPHELKTSIHPTELQRLCQQATDNGWTDADWLAGYALEGTSHPTVDNPTAVFITRLRDAASTPCPGTGTETPDPPAWTPPAVTPADPHRIQQYLAACRKALHR